MWFHPDRKKKKEDCCKPTVKCNTCRCLLEEEDAFEVKNEKHIESQFGSWSKVYLPSEWYCKRDVLRFGKKVTSIYNYLIDDEVKFYRRLPPQEGEWKEIENPF